MTTKITTEGQGDIIEVSFQLRAAYEVQKDLAAASTLQSEVVWDVLGPDQAYILEKKLECLYPDDKTVYTGKQDLRRANRCNAQLKELRRKLFRSIWEQRKYTNGVLLHSIVYIIVTNELDSENAKVSHNYTLHPIFRTRRCLKSNSTSSCCMIFIDDQSRIYQNWDDYVKHNELPIGTMVAPANGCYSLNNNDEVQLEYRQTPAYHKQSLAVVDKVVSAVSLVAQATSFFQPIFSLLAIGTKSYEIIRDYQNMSDKTKHGTASKATTYCNLSGNVISLTSSIATLGAHIAVSNGEPLSFNTTMSIQGVNGAATLINSTKLIFTTYDIFTKYFTDEEKLDFSDVIAFSSALILLTHSINNIAITSHLSKYNGNKLRSLLKTTIKSGLSLIAGNAIRLTAENGGRFDILRLANDIPNKDVLGNIYSKYKKLTCTGFLTTVASLGALGMEVAPGIAVHIINKEIVQLDFLELKKYFGSKFVKHIANSINLIDILNVMGTYFSEIVVQFMLNQTRHFVETVADYIDEQQNTFVTTEMILFQMLSYAVKTYKDFTYDYLDKKKGDLMTGVAQHFQSFNPKPSDPNKNAKRSCDVCGGYFYLTRLS